MCQKELDVFGFENRTYGLEKKAKQVVVKYPSRDGAYNDIEYGADEPGAQLLKVLG